VKFTEPTGRVIACESPLGDTVMECAMDHGVAGIVAQCGGGCTCATCHCYVAPPWLDKLPEPHPDELALLEYVYNRRPTSRLACQLFLTDELDGVEIELPPRQL
jgi:2Fe-2S ferredoxin